MAFPERFTAALDAAGLTKSEFAHSLKLTPSAVSQWCKGHTKPDSPRWLAVSELMGISVDELALLLAGDDTHVSSSGHHLKVADVAPEQNKKFVALENGLRVESTLIELWRMADFTGKFRILEATGIPHTKLVSIMSTLMIPEDHADPAAKQTD